MNETDLSDEAFWKWDEDINRQHMDKSFSEHALDGWQERGRREQLRYDQAIKCWSESIEEKNKEIEKARREAISFAIGRVLYADGIAPEIEVDETYLAFLQEREKNDPAA